MIKDSIDKRTFCNLIDPKASILEIGPYASPTFRRPFYNVSYADILTPDEIRAECGAHGYNKDLAPDHIDIMIDLNADPTIGTDLRFDAIFSSHTIEHQPDLIRHLNETANLTASQDSRYYLAIPDKHYCFDHFQFESTIAEVIGAHMEKRRRLLPSTLLQNELFVGHNFSGSHWNGDHGENPYPLVTAEKILKHMERAKLLETQYIDSHAWKFYPANFIMIISLLYETKLQPWRVEAIYPTLQGANEFYAILKME